MYFSGKLIVMEYFLVSTEQNIDNIAMNKIILFVLFGFLFTAVYTAPFETTIKGAAINVQSKNSLFQINNLMVFELWKMVIIWRVIWL